MTFTTACATCGDIWDSEGPWNDTVVYCTNCVESRDRMTEVLPEIKRQKALQSEGRLLAGMGVQSWDRKRGSETAERATVALRDIYAGLSIRDMIHLKALVDQEV